MLNDENRASLKLPERNVGPYEIEKFLKEGSSSKIFLAKSKYTGENVIIKVLSKSRLKNNLEDLLLITKQMETLKILKHRNIVSLYEIYESSKNFYFITEYLAGKDLIERLIKKKRFTEEEALRIFFQLLDAMTYMHKMKICHRNIRTEHILFDKNNRPKIIGFGYSTFYEKNKKIEGSYGSLCYACPEIIDEAPYNPELADVWSLGVILYVLICGYLPFSDDDDNRNKILIENAKIDFPKEISNKLKDLIRHMLDKNPAKRYTFQKIAKHPWIKPYSESLFSGGINIHKNIFPVDERLLNIINQYGFDKDKIKNDLIQNKYNIGTGVYKQIVRKLLDLKMKNISDLYSEDFLSYIEDENNMYKDGDQKYDEYIKKVDEKYKKIEDFITDFKEREDQVAEKLLSIQEKRESELAAVEEKKGDSDEEDNDKEEEKDVINEMENIENSKNNNDSIRRVKSHNVKSFNRTKTANYNFRELMHGKRGEILNNNILGDNINPDNIEIVYNKDEEVDIIQQFQEEQNKKLSDNLNNIYENDEDNENNLFIRRNSSSPNLLQDTDSNSNVANIKKSLQLSATPKKSQKDIIVKKLLLNKSGLDINIKNKKDELFNSNNENNNSNILNNHYKSIRSGNINDMNRGLLRMTTARKSNKKNYLDRGSFLDAFLKKNHPDNIRKTMLKEKNIYDSNIEEIKEGIKENDESDSENNKKSNSEEKDENDEKENDIEIKTSKDLKYSLNFDDDDEDDDEDKNEEENNFPNNRYSIGDSKLFALLDNGENDEELKELKRIYFNEDDKEEKKEKEKEKEKNKDKDKDKDREEDKVKDIIKIENKKKDEENNKENINVNDNDKEIKKDIKSSLFKDKNLPKSSNKKKVSFNIDNNEYSNLKISAITKKDTLNDEKDSEDNIDEATGRMRFNSQLEISFHDEIDGKFRCNIYEVYNNYINDTDPISKLQIKQNDNMTFNINDIYKRFKNKFTYSFIEDKPIGKIKIDINNLDNISNINEIFNKSNKNVINKDNKKGINQIKDNNININKDKKGKIKEIPFQEGKKKLIHSSSNSKKKIINANNVVNVLKKDQSTQTKNNDDDYLRKIYIEKIKKENEIKQKIKNLKKSNQTYFCIKAKYKPQELNYINERSFLDYNNDENITDMDYHDYELYNNYNRTFNPNANLMYYYNKEFPYKNNIPQNIYFYSNLPYDKNKKLILTKKHNPKIVIPRQRINNDINNNFVSPYTDKRIKNYIYKPFNNLYNNNLEISTEEKDLFKTNKKGKVNNYYSNIPKRGIDILNNNINLRLDDKNKKLKPNKKYDDINKELYLVDNISISSKKKSHDLSKDIKDEYLIKRKFINDNIHKLDKFDKILNNNDNNNRMTFIKTNYKSINYNNRNRNNNNLSISYVPKKTEKNNINIYEKLNNNNNNNNNNIDLSMYKIKNLIDNNNFIEKNNKIKTQILNKEQKTPYRKINIGYKEKEKLNDKNYMNYTNIIRDKEDKMKINYNMNSLQEKYLINNNKTNETIRNKYSNYRVITENDIINNNNKLNEHTYNGQNNNYNLLNNYNTEDVYPSYNKKKIGLYKNYEEIKNKNIKSKRRANIPLKNYLNNIDDNTFDMSHTQSIE